MISHSEHASLEAFPPQPSLEAQEESLSEGFRWLLKALLVWVGLMLTVCVPFFIVRKTAVLAMGCILGTTYLIDLRLLDRGHFKAASWTFISVTWLAAFLVVVFRGRIGSQYMVFLLAMTIVAGWMLGSRSMLFFSGLALLSTLLLAVLQALGFELPNYFSGRHPIMVWMLFGFSLVTAVMPLRFILRSLRDSVSVLRDSEERFRVLVHSINGIVWEADPETLQFTFVSQSAERILGYPVNAWKASKWFLHDHLHPEDRDQVLHLCGRVGQALGDYEFRCRMIAADGQVVWLHNKVQVVPENGGTVKLRGIMMDISRYAALEIERDQAVEALRQREEELLEAQRVAQVGSWVWDPHADIVTWSQQLYRIADLDPQLPPPPFKEHEQLFTPESWERLRAAVGEALRSATPYELDLEMVRPDGSRRWIVARGEALRDESGHVARLRGTAQDITERKKDEESLRLFRALIDQSNDSIEVVDPVTFQFLDVNARACLDHGYSREEFLSMNVFDIDPDARATEAKVRRALEHSGFQVFDSYHRRRDGTTFPVEVAVSSIQLDRKYYLAVVRDITQRKRAEEALQASEARFRSLFESSPDAILLTDAGGKIIEMNSQVLEVFGYDRAELAGKPIETLIPERFRQAHPGHRANYGAEPRTRPMGQGLDLYGARKDGSEFPVDIMLSPVETAEGRVALSVIRDITARKRAEEALRQQEAKLRGLFQLAKTLTGTLELPLILDLLNFQSINLVGAEAGCAGLRTEQGLACDSFFQEGIRREMHLAWPPGVGIPGRVLESKKPYLTNDAARDPLIPAKMREALGLWSVLSVPILDARGEVMAFFALHNKQGGGFVESDVETVEGIAQVASIAIQNALAYQRIQQAESELRRLSARLINSQDEERRRIARELHETTAQDLAALRMSLGRVNRLVSHLPAPAQEAIQEALQLSDRLIQAVRTLSYLLHPPLLDVAGLCSAVTWYAEGFSKRSGIDVKVELADDLGRFPRECETTLFRIMQECLTNVHNHSGSRRARVRLARENGHVLMEVQDFGKGMAGWSDRGPESGAQIGVGIAGMRERVKQFHGTLDIDSTRGQGTTVRVVLPIAKTGPRRRYA
jgi:PAS domain S-box-containing protein